ncbi:His-Xaa-Ser system radical SAM maturase HxsC [Polynucleobacter sp. MWH-Jannik1A5]|uniref:His-Xaa-Ser system radical SAM maturase HxsC n=1 Tax=Polynucleobacter sp. MWH-Jannik1A5 TaxID=1855890 RepID=UPI001C0BD88E|nr:His-Xaa-Ser system radical SAM maturase HxsC [Polynucleobacter sp. MWH-Jannik1A5]MBU3547471.1 His-Xaa-Ser system radical SAM maturase HxsC [Polynucleobacter sp. MWH-Jannik1A5]
MLKLHGNALDSNIVVGSRQLFTVTRSSALVNSEKRRYAYLLDGMDVDSDYGCYLDFGGTHKSSSHMDGYLNLPKEMGYLAEGDIISVEPSGHANVVFRVKSPHNTILLTERCNHYCLMCSQPPKDVDDSWLMSEAMGLLDLIPKETGNIGFSGGEPTLYGAQFIELISKAKKSLPTTAIDVLSNGRRFSDLQFTQAYAAINHPDCLLGIPIYSDDPVRHDYIVQSSGAFDETVRGILNLKKYNQKVEIRIVIHKQSIERLVQTCEFIARNLLFVDHVALMGLEMMGFTRANLDSLWIDPIEYKDTLSEAVAVLNAYGIRASVYNHQLCLVNPDVLPNYVKSISDWKNEFVDECNPCQRKSECGGFFSSSKIHRYSDNISPFIG